MAQIFTTLIALAIAIEFLTEGVKWVLPEKIVKDKEKIIAFIVSLIICLVLPCIKAYNIGWLSTLNIVERILLSLFVFRGAQVLYDLQEKYGIGK